MYAASHLPDDLERIIFEAAAEDRATAVRLSLVAQRVRTWISPLLYRVVTLDRPRKAKAFWHTLQSSSIPDSSHFFAKHVKSVTFTHDVGARLASSILSRLPHVDSLAYWLEESGPALSTVVNSTLRPTRLSGSLTSLLGTTDPSFSCPLFQNLSHLEVTDHWPNWSSFSWSGLKGLRRLTHLALDLGHPPAQDHIIAPAVINVLNHCPPTLLVCLVMIFRESELLDHLRRDGNDFLRRVAAGEIDPRLVLGINRPPVAEHHRLELEPLLAVCPNNGDVDEWEAHSLGRPDVWMVAERLVRKRRAAAETRSRL